MAVSHGVHLDPLWNIQNYCESSQTRLPIQYHFDGNGGANCPALAVDIRRGLSC